MSTRITAGRFKVFTCGVLLAALAAPGAVYAAFNDPIDTPALVSAAPALEPLLAAATSGRRIVAAGARGVVIYSDDSGVSWRQAAVPVESDLVDLQFPAPDQGWACGHDGMLLHSTDGGMSWTKTMDGRDARTWFEAYYNQQIAAGNKALAADLQQIQLNYDNGPALPWLGLWFTSPQTGYIVGSFGDIAVTGDGGKTWQPWLDHIDNPSFLNLNAIRPVGGNLYIVGEQGTVYQLDPTGQKFVARPTGYAGSLFGATGTAGTLIVYGLRGTIFRSEDQGKTWVPSKNPSGANIVNGTVLADGHIALVNLDGQILISADDGVSFQPASDVQDMLLSDILDIGHGDVILTGLSGVRSVAQK